MTAESPANSPDRRRQVWQLQRVIWLAVIVMAGVALGALAGRLYGAWRIHQSPPSPAGDEYGYMMPELRLERTTLRQALDTLARQSSAKIDVDWTSLHAVGVNPDTPVNLDLRLHHVWLNQVLPIVLDAAEPVTALKQEIAFDATPTGVRVSTPAVLFATPKSTLKIYDARGYLEKVHRARELYGDAETNEFTMISRWSSPPMVDEVMDDEAYLTARVNGYIAGASVHSSAASGGTIQLVDGKLIIVQTPAGLHDIEALFSELFAEREPSPSVAPFPVDADEELARKIPDLRLGDVTFYQAIEKLRECTGANIVVHWSRMAAVGFPPDSRVDLTVHDVTLEAAIEHILASTRPHDVLPVMGVRNGMIQISMPADLGENLPYTRLYSVEDLLGQPANGAATKPSVQPLVDRMRREIGGEEWAARLRMRLWAGRLVVTLPREGHHKVAALLQSLREGK